MMARCRDAVRWTHRPTGTTATVYLEFFAGFRRGRTQQIIVEASKLGRRLLASILCRPVESPNPVRSYHLHPPLGIEPFIKQGDERIATGRENVQRVLDGEIGLISPVGETEGS